MASTKEKLFLLTKACLNNKDFHFGKSESRKYIELRTTSRSTSAADYKEEGYFRRKSNGNYEPAELYPWDYRKYNPSLPSTDTIYYELREEPTLYIHFEDEPPLILRREYRKKVNFMQDYGINVKNSFWGIGKPEVWGFWKRTYEKAFTLEQGSYLKVDLTFEEYDSLIDLLTKNKQKFNIEAAEAKLDERLKEYTAV